MPSMKYRQAARPLASVVTPPAKNSLAPLDKGKEREPPRSIQTIMPNKAGKGALRCRGTIPALLRHGYRLSLF
jgi:hypothetical protein